MKNKFNFMATSQSAVDANSFSIAISCMMKLTLDVRTTKLLERDRRCIHASFVVQKSPIKSAFIVVLAINLMYIY